MNAYPLLIEFVSGTRITREPEVLSKLPILQNGPPGTSVVFRDGAEVPLPTDQIVFTEDGGGAAHVGFGGMSFDGLDGGQRGQTTCPSTAMEATMRGSSVILRPRWGDSSASGFRSRTRRKTSSPPSIPAKLIPPNPTWAAPPASSVKTI